MQNYSTAELDRFWNKVQKTDTCWLWTGSIDNLGYGRIRGWVKAHRASWQIHFGPIPEGMNVCHHCDVRNCVRPDHLFLGTQKDNVHDMFRKGRGNRAKGERNSHAKLTTEKVLAIRAKYLKTNMTQADVAEKFNISVSQVNKIVTGKHWKHI